MAVYIFECKKFAFLLFKFKVPLKFLTPSRILENDQKSLFIIIDGKICQLQNTAAKEVFY